MKENTPYKLFKNKYILPKVKAFEILLLDLIINGKQTRTNKYYKIRSKNEYCK